MSIFNKSATEETKEQNANTKVVVFDFDGTLADVEEVFRKIYDELADEYNYPKMDDESFDYLRTQSLKNIYKWMGIKPWQVPAILSKGRKYFSKYQKEVKLFDQTSDLIISLNEKSIPIYILSSNSEATIRKILKRNKLDSMVTILRRPKFMGKANSLEKLAQNNGYKKQNIFMIGDESRDIKAARKSGVRGVAVTWGLQHKIALAHEKPERIINSIDELKKFLLKEASGD